MNVKCNFESAQKELYHITTKFSIKWFKKNKILIRSCKKTKTNVLGEQIFRMITFTLRVMHFHLGAYSCDFSVSIIEQFSLKHWGVCNRLHNLKIKIHYFVDEVCLISENVTVKQLDSSFLNLDWTESCPADRFLEFKIVY